MLKTVDIVLVAIMLCVAGWTFGTKHEAELIEERLRVVERQIAQERDTISLLEADWALLDQPYRLQRLADAFAEELGLAPLEPEQVVAPDELPAEPVRLSPEQQNLIGDLADASRSSAR
ncbi:cell division protein FtsL [Aureimonas populi]|uniref:Cell division protein FtsL n=1 Tax=Aureimonas populi TaxID=1701758 RepID=A0ABW5CL29_9HYPH|nr:hypothetical protein [Aureimonas populi]